MRTGQDTRHKNKPTKHTSQTDQDATPETQHTTHTNQPVNCCLITSEQNRLKKNKYHPTIPPPLRHTYSPVKVISNRALLRDESDFAPPVSTTFAPASIATPAPTLTPTLIPAAAPAL